MVIKKAKNEINRFGIRKYGKTESKSQEGMFYDVGKVRVKNTKRYKYVCTCPDFFYRQRICRHIKEFKKAEQKMR